jgi:hypothetical protein
MMKRIIFVFVGLFVLFMLLSCTDGKSNLTINKEFVKTNAEIGLSKSDIKKKFGVNYKSGTADGGELWLYDETIEGYEYERRLDVVAHEEIIQERIVSQLFINILNNKAFMYSFFYKGEDGKVWEYVLNPDGTNLEIPVS